MVLEALAAVGLAGNVVQLVHFSSSLLSKTREIHHSALGGPKEHFELEAVAKHLAGLIQRIQEQSPALSTFSELVGRCEQVSTELLSTLHELRRTNTPTSSKRWKSFRQAFKAVLGKDRIVELQTRLSTLRDEVMLHLVSAASDQLAEIMIALRDLHNKNNSLGDGISTEVGELSKQFRAMMARVNQEPGHLERNWDLVHTKLATLCDALEKSQSRLLVNSLYYESLPVRHDAIASAHARTFDWIFNNDKLSKKDPRSNINFLTWLERGSQIYWVTGKPASGKSTLMKYLDGHPIALRALNNWANGVPLVTASFYFWSPGTSMQKSLRGLLQSLLFYIVKSQTVLIPILFPERWKRAQALLDQLPWTVGELQDALKALKEHHTVAKFYFHIDGVDEYHGDHWEVISVLQELSQAPNVKLCVSSRPWNCFQDAFSKAGSHVLRLHELTRPDIELFASETLRSHRCSTGSQEEVFSSLTHEIAERAQGVFLWVRLVVRSLREGLTNDDPISLLSRRLEALPTDLEEFFMHILNSVEPIYYQRMACTFLAALRQRDPLSILQASFLEEDDPNFGLELSFHPFSPEEIQRRFFQTRRWLNGRYKGLLEPSTPPRASLYDTLNSVKNIKIQFLHRTLWDFLSTERMRAVLQSRLPSRDFVWRAIGRSLFAETKYLIKSPKLADFTPVVEFASAAADATGNVLNQYEILDHADTIVQNSSSEPLPSFLWMAVHIGREDYIEHRLAQPGASHDLSELLLHSILCPPPRNATFKSIVSNLDAYPPFCRINAQLIYPDNAPLYKTVQTLLKAGADPNGYANGMSVRETILTALIEGLNGSSRETFCKVFELLVQHGINIKESTEIFRTQLVPLLAIANDAPREYQQCYSRVFNILIDHGLRFSRTDRNCTIWAGYLELFESDYRGTSIMWKELLERFIGAGASVAQFYEEHSASRLNNILHAIENQHHPPGLDGVLLEFEFFLQNGLDPNAQFKTRTIWTSLLHSIQIQLDNPLMRPMYHLGSSTAARETYSRLVELFLKYGADPRCSELYHMIGWSNGGKSHFVPAQISRIEEVLRKELQQEQSRHHYANFGVGKRRRGTATGDVDTSARAGKRRNGFGRTLEGI